MRAIYPGSFDPVTYGHIDIIRRCHSMFDELVIGVLDNVNKTPLFSVDERVKMLQEVTKEFPNVRVDSFSGLLIDYCKENDIHVAVRGLRAITDFEYELQNAQTNRLLSNDDLETIFFIASLDHSYLSSSAVREISQFGGDVSKCVPETVEKMLHQKFNNK